MKFALRSLVFGLGFMAVAHANNPLVGVTFYNYDDSFIQLMRDKFEQSVSQKPILTFLFNDAQNSQTVQNDQVQTLLNKKAKVVAVNLVDPAASVTVIGKTKNQLNTPVIFFNKDPGEKAINSYNHAYYVGTDPQQSGKIQADLIEKHWKANPALDLNHDDVIQYALLKGESGHPDAEIRTRAVIEALEAKGFKTEAVEFDSAKWNKQLAKQKVTEWLAGDNRDKIEVIIANNDAMALGALEATRTQRKHLPIYGVDAMPDALKLIKAGELAGTVLNDADRQVAEILSLTEKLAAGQKVENRVIRVPYQAVDSQNIAKFIK